MGVLNMIWIRTRDKIRKLMRLLCSRHTPEEQYPVKSDIVPNSLWGSIRFPRKSLRGPKES
jgi:hypothetical protein